MHSGELQAHVIYARNDMPGAKGHLIQDGRVALGLNNSWNYHWVK
jgi:hypothetical protein